MLIRVFCGIDESRNPRVTSRYYTDVVGTGSLAHMHLISLLGHLVWHSTGPDWQLKFKELILVKKAHQNDYFLNVNHWGF